MYGTSVPLSPVKTDIPRTVASTTRYAHSWWLWICYVVFVRLTSVKYPHEEVILVLAMKGAVFLVQFRT